jgi:hypothetical protein
MAPSANTPAPPSLRRILKTTLATSVLFLRPSAAANHTQFEFNPRDPNPSEVAPFYGIMLPPITMLGLCEGYRASAERISMAVDLLLDYPDLEFLGVRLLKSELLDIQQYELEWLEFCTALQELPEVKELLEFIQSTWGCDAA